MNRRNFVKSFCIAGAALSAPVAMTLSAIAEEPAIAELPPFPDINKLADGFAEVERCHWCVTEVRIHPEDFEALFTSTGGINGALDKESRKKFLAEGVRGYLWGAVVIADPGIPRSRVKIISDTYEATMFADALTEPGIAWV